jgi:hypothetical protein
METETAAMTAWKLTFRGRSWALDDTIEGATPITGAQVLRVALEMQSDTWEALNPARSPNALMTWLAVLIADGNPDLTEAYIQITSSTAAELIRSVTFAAQSSPEPSMNGL